jgi:hypothetical protein
MPVGVFSFAHEEKQHMQTAILIERGAEPISIRTDQLNSFIDYAPPQNSLDRQAKSFKRVDIIEKRDGDKTQQVGIYARLASGLKESEAKEIGAREADLFLNPEKYKDQRTEVEKLREENARLRTLSTKG